MTVEPGSPTTRSPGRTKKSGMSPRRSPGSKILKSSTKTSNNNPKSPRKIDPLDDLKGFADAVDEIEYVEVDEDTSYRSLGHLHSPLDGSSRGQLRRSSSLSKLQTSEDEIIEYVVDDTEFEEVNDDDDDEVEEVIEDDDDDDGEYYEEIEIADEGEGEYEEVVLEDDRAGGSPSSPGRTGRRAKVTISDDEEILVEEIVDDRHHGGDGDEEEEVVLPEDEDQDEEEEEEEEPEDLPDRDDVIEAINYIMAQEQVVKYGLVSQAQCDEMLSLPLPELTEIMNHFEACDNNNATIRWDLVLALVNPKYASDIVDDGSDDECEDEEADKVAELGGAGTPAAANSAASSMKTPGEDGSASGDGVSIQSDVNVNGCNELNEHASVGSGYSLEVNKLDCDSSMSNNSDNGDDLLGGSGAVGGTGDGGGGSSGYLDPLKRAEYTKSMVQLERNRSFGK